jgi:hypothetical protein
VPSDIAVSGWLGGKLAYRYGVRVADEQTQSEGFVPRRDADCLTAMTSPVMYDADRGEKHDAFATSLGSAARPQCYPER